MFPFGLHEIEFGVSIVPLILIFFIFFLNKKNFKLNYQSVYLFLLLITIFLIPVLLNINFLNQFQLIQKIPILENFNFRKKGIPKNLEIHFSKTNKYFLFVFLLPPVFSFSCPARILLVFFCCLTISEEYRIKFNLIYRMKDYFNYG